MVVASYHGISVTRTRLMAKLCTGKHNKAIPTLQLATGNVAVNSTIMSKFAIPNSNRKNAYTQQ